MSFSVFTYGRKKTCERFTISSLRFSWPESVSQERKLYIFMFFFSITVFYIYYFSIFMMYFFFFSGCISNSQSFILSLRQLYICSACVFELQWIIPSSAYLHQGLLGNCFVIHISKA